MITIFGGHGYIGSNIANYLKKNDMEYWIPEREDKLVFNRNLGNVIYCIGLTSDFRNKPFETVEAHISYLSKILKSCSFKSFVYLSSTRIYNRLSKNLIADEDLELKVDPKNPSDLYNISKIMGEAVCLSQKSKNVKIVRISNVYGNDFNSGNFLSDIVKDIIINQQVVLRTTLLSEKDYIFIDDVVEIIIKILLYGKENLYNVASGTNYTTLQILNEIGNYINFKVDVNKDAQEIVFPKISIKKIKSEFGFNNVKLEKKIGSLIKTYKEVFENEYSK